MCMTPSANPSELDGEASLKASARRRRDQQDLARQGRSQQRPQRH